MSTTSETEPRDHRWGAGRLDPGRLRRVLLVRRGHGHGRLIGLVETLLLVVLLVSVARDASPVSTLRIMVEWVVTVVRALATLLLSVGGV